MVHVCHWPAILLGKNFIVVHYMQTVQPNFFIPAILIGTIDFYHFIPISLTMTLPRGYKVSANKTFWLHFPPHCSSDQDEI